jgi:hypothetical protein
MKPLIDKFWDRESHMENGLKQDFENVAPKKKTQVFVLSPEVALAAENLIRSKSFAFPPVDEMRMPYEHTAIEYEMTPDVLKLRDNGLSGTTPLARVGAYVREVKEPHAFTCTPYWEFADGSIQNSVFSFTYGLGGLGKLEKPKGVATMSLSPNKDGQGAIDVMILPNAALLVGAVEAKVPPKQLADALLEPDAQTHMREAGVEVPLLLFACSMLLTCRSGMARARVDARTPNQSGLGAKKRKQLSASAYTLMHLSALETVSSTGEITSHIGTAAHYVRGHFKQRKSGVYWWNSFVRGTGEPRKRTAYTVGE